MGPDDGPAWAIGCTRSISECCDECARVCPRGYNILDKNNEGYASRAGAVGGDGWAVANRSSTVDRISMLISCRRCAYRSRLEPFSSATTAVTLSPVFNGAVLLATTATVSGSRRTVDGTTPWAYYRVLNRMVT